MNCQKAEWFWKAKIVSERTTLFSVRTLPFTIIHLSYSLWVLKLVMTWLFTVRGSSLLQHSHMNGWFSIRLNLFLYAGACVSFDSSVCTWFIVPELCLHVERTNLWSTHHQIPFAAFYAVEFAEWGCKRRMHWSANFCIWQLLLCSIARKTLY